MTKIFPPTLLLIRHGQTAWNQARKVLGRTDIPLDETGRAQAATLPERVGRVDAVWASPLSRAVETARALGEPKLEPDLVEMDQGELEGLGSDELLDHWKDLVWRFRNEPQGVRLPGGETLDEVQARGLRALRRIADAEGQGRIAVVTHQLVLATIVCALREEPLSEWRHHSHENCTWTEVEAGERLRLVASKVQSASSPSIAWSSSAPTR